MSRLLLMLAVTSCTSEQQVSASSPKVSPLAAPLPGLAPIESLPHLELGPAPDDGIDCRLSVAIRHRFPHEQMRPCGTLGVNATADQIAESRRCITASIENQEPFLLEQSIEDPRDAVAHAVFATRSKAGYDVFHASYVMPPCTNDAHCPIMRNAQIVYCPRAMLQSCTSDVMACVHCGGEELIETCSTYYKRTYD